MPQPCQHFHDISDANENQKIRNKIKTNHQGFKNGPWLEFRPKHQGFVLESLRPQLWLLQPHLSAIFRIIKDCNETSATATI